MMKVLTEKEKKAKYLRELQKIFKGVDANKKRVLQAHLDNIAYMKAKLETLQEMIDAEGLVEVYQNGENQYGTKPSTAVKAYNDIVRSYNTLYKEIAPFIPLAQRESKLSML